MISVLLIVFLLQLAIRLINTAGKDTVNDIIWLLFTKLPTPQAKEASELSTLRSEVVRLNREMTNTSAQDEFAKWAKLRRQHDKAKEKYEQRAQSQQAFQNNFNKAISALRWAGTQGLQFLCNFYFSKQAMFWLPAGWVPYPAEWVLSFPRAPLGSISINIWAMACASVIALVQEAVIGVWTLRSGQVQAGPRKGEAIQMEAVGGKQKKEL